MQNCDTEYDLNIVFLRVGAPVAQWVKYWPTDLVVLSSSPAQDENFSTVNGVPFAQAFHYHVPIVQI